MIDTYSKVGFAKLYTRKTPLTAADILNDRVIPFCDEHDIRVDRILTELLTRLVNGWPQARIDALMPWNCLAETDG